MWKPKWIFHANKFTLALILGAVFFGFLAIGSRAGGQEQTGGTQQPAATPAEYAEADACAACHEDVVESLKKTPHGQTGFAARSEWGCQTCHGSGKAHVDSGGEKALIKKVSALPPAEAAATCLQCHETGKQTFWKGSIHQQRDLSCITCHSIHHAKSETAQLKTTRMEETCISCHLDIKAQIQRTSHHPIREGLMTCGNCHNPHGTVTPKLITANSVNEQCYTCHAEKRGPYLWEHPPVRETCMNCHTPHGSNHEKLMVQNRPWLCQSCHLDTRHPGSLYDGSNALTSNREFARACSNCHITVHGSNHPSGWTFLR